ncbi:MAG TPA: hypothetical protein VN541_08855 [Tepidisphaeraceae bacterium]|nr:hypothetical protein [Tepidisphaeraceae bacterium]
MSGKVGILRSTAVVHAADRPTLASNFRSRLEDLEPDGLRLSLVSTFNRIQINRF